MFDSWVLFAILFLWQIPHSLAIARLYRDDYANAAKYFAQSLALEALPAPVAQQVRYSLAQLYLAEEQYPKSVKTMNQWFEVAKTTCEAPSAFTTRAEFCPLVAPQMGRTCLPGMAMSDM